MLLKPVVIWTRIDQVIRLRNDINFFLNILYILGTLCNKYVHPFDFIS